MSREPRNDGIQRPAPLGPADAERSADPVGAQRSRSAPTRGRRQDQVKNLVVGAGPAGLYFTYLFMKRNPSSELRVVEQNAADSTFGFGVVFSDKALEFLRADDPDTYDAMDGHRLVSNRSVRRNFPTARNTRWSAGKVVLIGDAQRTAHFSIG